MTYPKNTPPQTNALGHTPTPWAMRQERDDWEVYPLRDGPPKLGEWSAVATCHDQHDDSDEAKANAELIVAAVNAYVTAGKEPPQTNTTGEYLVWSNEHKCWWGPNRAGYVGRLADAGRYTREEAIKICVNARGGRQFNSNPSEVPLPLADAELFWPDDKEEWRIARHKHENPETWEYEE